MPLNPERDACLVGSGSMVPGFGGVRVDEVTRDTHSPEEISGLEKRRKVAQIGGMIAEFERIGGDLDRRDQDRAGPRGIHDPGHFAYPTYAKAPDAARENLKRSADELKIQLETPKGRLGEAFEEMKKVELLDERDQFARAGRGRCPPSRPSSTRSDCSAMVPGLSGRDPSSQVGNRRSCLRRLTGTGIRPPSGTASLTATCDPFHF